MPINLAIVDDHSLFRKTLTDYLSEQENIHVSVQSSGIFDLFKQLQESPTDLLLMDIFMPEMNGNEALKMIRRQYPDMRILVLSMSTDTDLISEMLESGIHGYISKSDEPEELIRAIHVIAEGRLFRNRLFTEALYKSKQDNIEVYTAQPRIPLSERERRILQLIWEEKSNKEIADELFLGVRSVEKIRQDIKEKIGTRSTVGLLKYAIHKKIIAPGFHSSDLLE